MRSITSAGNPILKHVRRLFRDGGYRRECGEFIVEGYRIFDSARELHTVLLREEAEPPLGDLSGADVAVLPAALFDKLSDEASGQTVIGVCKMPRTEMILRKEGRYLFLDALQDPGNTGTVIRTAAGFGLDAVLFGENCADPYSPKVVRSSAGGVFKLPLYRPVAMEALCGHRIITADMRGDPLPDVREEGGFVLVIGNEGAGVSAEIDRLSSRRVAVPMPGGTESLNAAVSAGIILYELCLTRTRGA
jgi:TrmH family RNA methyltransferase